MEADDGNDNANEDMQQCFAVNSTFQIQHKQDDIVVSTPVEESCPEKQSVSQQNEKPGQQKLVPENKVEESVQPSIYARLSATAEVAEAARDHSFALLCSIGLLSVDFITDILFMRDVNTKIDYADLTGERVETDCSNNFSNASLPLPCNCTESTLFWFRKVQGALLTNISRPVPTQGGTCTITTNSSNPNDFLHNFSEPNYFVADDQSTASSSGDLVEVSSQFLISHWDSCGCKEPVVDDIPILDDSTDDLNWYGTYVMAQVIALLVVIEVATTTVREVTRLAFILYNLVTTSPEDKVKHPHWAIYSPFVLLFKFFHPPKWQEMVQMHNSKQDLYSSVGMLVNLLTEDIMSIVLCSFSFVNDILSGRYYGKETDTEFQIAAASVAASGLATLYHTYNIRRQILARKLQQNGMENDVGNSSPLQQDNATIMDTTPPPENRFQRIMFYTAMGIMVVDVFSDIALIFVGYDWLFANVVMYFYLLAWIGAREIFKIMVAFRNLCHSSSDLVQPKLMAESPFVLMWIWIFRPDQWDEIVEYHVSQRESTVFVVVFNLMTQDVLSIGLALARLLAFDDGAVYARYKEAAIVSLSASLAMVTVSGIRFIPYGILPLEDNATHEFVIANSMLTPMIGALVIIIFYLVLAVIIIGT